MDSEVISDLEDVDWSFDGVDTQKSIHSISKYPARMIPQIPDKMFDIFKEHGVISDNGTVYDPFVGSGTTVSVAKTKNMYGIGNDINPFAVYLSRVKSTCVDTEEINDCFYDIKRNILSRLDTEAAKNITDENINSGWFPEPQESQLLYIREQLNVLEESYSSETILPFRIVLSTIARECSYQRNGEYKRYRIPEEDRESHNPDVKQLFEQESGNIINSLIKFSNCYSDTPPSVINLQDSRETTINENSVDIVGSSPPYGDHSTTVAYGQFSRDPSIIAFGKNKTEMLDVDKKGLGGKYSVGANESITTKSTALEKTITELESVDGRSEDALEFFTDFFHVMEDVYRVLKPGKPVFWVVANRTMSRTNIPTNLITKELSTSIGFSHEVTLPRDIPTKTLPWENAPENEEGNKGDLMADENILVLTK